MSVLFCRYDTGKNMISVLQGLYKIDIEYDTIVSHALLHVTLN